ncbi:hypothetical protein AB0J20_02815 [Micromonospora costi]|uniref:hypothetical protein n=1 Tax=Micromonospora costi TaxID=1530042 RepID=UPI0033FDAE59
MFRLPAVDREAWVRVSMATSAGTPGRPNEDFVGAVPGAVVLLDGAGIPGTGSICAHGVAWYTRRLGAALLARLSRDGGRALTAILATSIDEVTAAHRGTCDVTHPASPQATVAIVRSCRGSLEHLVLADCTVVLGPLGGCPQVVTDEREVTNQRICAEPLRGIARGTPAYDRVRAACSEALRARRNQPGGYWIAKDDPRAAEEAVTGSRPLDDLSRVALLSNGASRIVSPYGLTDWAGVLELLDAHGPADVVRRIREAEARPGAAPDAPVPDDATVAHCTRLASS